MTPSKFNQLVTEESTVEIRVVMGDDRDPRRDTVDYENKVLRALKKAGIVPQHCEPDADEQGDFLSVDVPRRDANKSVDVLERLGFTVRGNRDHDDLPLPE